MVTGSKPADAKGKGAGRPKKGDTPEFDFGSLEFKEAEMPKPASTNPFVKPLGESYEYDTARAVTIPEAGQSRAEGLIRRAADELKIGVSIVAGKARNEKGDEIPGMVEIVFKGKERRKRKSKGTEDAPAAGTPAAEDTGTAEPTGNAGGSADAESNAGAREDAGTVSVPAAAQ
jgi:hypothetical protein